MTFEAWDTVIRELQNKRDKLAAERDTTELNALIRRLQIAYNEGD